MHIVTKSSLFKINYGKDLRIGFEIRNKRKNVKAEKFVKKIKKMYKEAKVALKKLQEKMKKYADKNRKKIVEYKVWNKVLLRTKKLVR